MSRRIALPLALVALATCSRPALAAGWDAAFARALPQEDLAKAAVDAFPDVQRAKAELGLARAQSRELDAGPYEFTVNGNNVDSYPRLTMELSRTIRLPGKGGLDRKAGRLGVKAAEDLVDDARHQTGITLSDAWYAWAQAGAELTLDREIEAALAKDAQALRRRLELKDASQLDVEQAEAALAAAGARRAISEGHALTARLALLRAFPNLPLPASPPTLPEPPPLEHPAAEWADITVRSSHEIAIADFQAQRAEAEAARARLDRIPDPTIGLRTIPDTRPNAGNELEGIGVYVAVPIPGRKRQALADQQAARATAAEIALARVRRESAALGERNAVTAEASRAAWRSAAAAAVASEAVAARTQRAFQLGEVDLAQTLLLRRQLAEAKRAEIAARADAWRAVTHLRLDAHDLWHDTE